MRCQNENTKNTLENLFRSFVELGLHGKYNETLALLDDAYLGVGVGEQGIVRGKQHVQFILKEGYAVSDETKLHISIANIMVTMLSEDSAIIVGEVHIETKQENLEIKRSRLIQTVGARFDGVQWLVSFTQASVLEIDKETYPIQLKSETIAAIYSELNKEKSICKDSLTGILNREGFMQFTSIMMEKYNPKINTALFLIDLDDFKQINDKLGHQTGDLVLQKVAQILSHSFRNEDVVGRIGGDEFMVYIKGDFSIKFLEKKAQELLKAMHLQVSDDQQVPISISVGIAYGRSKITFEKCYRIADTALYSAKNGGKNQYFIINVDTNTKHSYKASNFNFVSLQSLLVNTIDEDNLNSKTPYEALIENVPGGVVMFEITKDNVAVNHCNEWFSHFLGYTEEEIETMQKGNPFVFLHPDDLATAIHCVNALREGADNDNSVYRVCKKDGTYAYVNQVTTVTERCEDSISAYAIETDVNEVLCLQRELQDAKKELDTFLGSIPGGVLSIRINDGLKLTHRNDWIPRFLGYTKEEVEAFESAHPLTLVHPDDYQIIEDAIQRLIDGQEYTSFIYRLLANDQQYRHVRITASQVERNETELIYNGVITGVDEMISIQQKLEDTNHKLEVLLSAIPGGIAIYEISDTIKITQYGNWMFKFTGYESNEELEAVRKGSELATIWHEDVSRAQTEIQKIKDNETDLIFLTVRMVCKDGRLKSVNMQGSVIERSDDKVTMYAIYTAGSANE